MVNTNNNNDLSQIGKVKQVTGSTEVVKSSQESGTAPFKQDTGVKIGTKKTVIQVHINNYNQIKFVSSSIMASEQ